MHHDLDRRVADDVPERVRSRTASGSITRQPLARRDLDQAEHRLERFLGDELGIEGEPAARPQVLDQRALKLLPAVGDDRLPEPVAARPSDVDASRTRSGIGGSRRWRPRGSRRGPCAPPTG